MALGQAEMVGLHELEVLPAMSARLPLRTGAGLLDEPALQAMLVRERRLLEVIDDPFAQYSTMITILCMYLGAAGRDPAFWLIIITFVAATVGCSLEDHDASLARGICAGPSTHTVRGRPPGGAFKLSTLSISHRKSVLYGAFVWARRALNS